MSASNAFKGFRRFFRESKEQIRSHPLLFVTYLVLRLIVLFALIRAGMRGDLESVFVCALVLVLFSLPLFIERALRINIPTAMEIIILLFIFAAEILGELQSYYIHFPYWDAMLHAINGFICAAFGFSLIDILSRNKQEKFRLPPLYLALAAFCFSMTVGVVWEFFEYGVDVLFLKDMQKDTVVSVISSTYLDPTASNQCVVLPDITSTLVNGQPLEIEGYLDIGLHDTMRDLLVNFIGAALFSGIGYFYVKNRGKGAASQLAQQFIPVITEDVAERKDHHNEPHRESKD